MLTPVLIKARILLNFPSFAVRESKHDINGWHFARRCRMAQRAKMMRREQLSKLAQLGVLVHGISQLVHMLQCERGASNVWLCSQGKLYAPECKASRALVDENLAALYAILETQSPIPGSAVCERIGGALLSLETLPALRDGVIQQTVTAPQAMEHYSRMLRHLLSIVPQLNDSIDDPQIAGRFVALYSLMQGKELAGQERALGAIGFTQGFFDDVTRQRLVDRIDGQQACFEIFSHTAPLTFRPPFQCTVSPIVKRSSSGAWPVPASPPPITALPRWPGLLCKPRALSICARWRRRSSPI
jgi:hypothetical protein